MKFKGLFWIIFTCGLLGGAALGVRWQIEEARSIRPEFRSLAKVIVTLEPHADDGSPPLDADLYGTCTEILESAEMQHRALERMRAQHQELGDHEIEIRTARTPGSGIINILASGDEAKYTRLFLDALVDEFIAFRQSLREQRHGHVLQGRLKEIVILQQALEETVSQHARARAASPPTQGPAEIERLTVRLTSLRNQRDDLHTTLRQEAAAEPRQKAAQDLKALELDISDCEEQIKKYSTALQELRQFEEARAKAAARYEADFAQIEALQKQYAAEIDPVALHERATPPSITRRSPMAQILAGGVMGAVLGGVAGFVAAFIASWRPAKTAPLEA